MLELTQRFGIEAEVEKGALIVRGPVRWWGRTFMLALLAAARERGVQFLAPACADRISLAEGECCGVRALALDSGETLDIRARGTILCGGGHSGIFLRHDNPGRTTGDCLALAEEAGATLRDMEFLKLHPLGLAEGEWGDLVVFGPALRAGRLQLADGSPVVRAELDALWQSRAQPTERDDERFDAFVDLSDADWSDGKLGVIRQELLAGIPVTERPVRVSPLAHYTTGGIAIGPHGQTGVPYLFAAGECTGGVFGAGRPGGAALTDCLVFGRRAGAELGRLARRREAMPEAAVSAVEFSGADDPGPALEEARAILWNYASVAPTAAGLQRCGAELRRLGAATEAMQVGTPGAWLDLHELRCVVRVGFRVVERKTAAGM